MSFTPRQLSPQELEIQEKGFLALGSDPIKTEAAWQEMHSFFATATVKDDQSYWDTYFRWYTILTWRLFSSMEKDVVISIACARQIPMALMLDFDVWKELLLYFNLRIIEAEELKSFYTKCKNSFFNSQSIIGQWENKNVTLHEIIDQWSKSEIKSNSLKKAEFLSKLRRIMYPNDVPQKYFFAEPNQCVDYLIGLINFFSGIESDQIFYIMDEFFHPELYENTKNSVTPIDQVESTNSVQSDSRMNSISTPVSPVTIENPAPMSPAEIQSRVDAQFEKDENGQYKDLEGVFAALDEIASTYNDESIRELFYFDEQSGGFKWREG